VTLSTIWSFSTYLSLEDLKLPMSGPMEDTVVIKLYGRVYYQFPVVFIVAVASNLLGRVLLMPCFPDGNARMTTSQGIHTVTSTVKKSA
jgi:hypothetical protein